MAVKKRSAAKPAALDVAKKMEAFALCRHRLERAVANSCEIDQPWAARITGAIYASLEFAASDPGAARLLTVHAAVRRFGGGEAFEAMIDHFADLFSQGAPERKRRAAASPNSALTRIARQTYHQVENGRAEEMVEIAPGLIAYVLTPYVGYEEAKRWSNWRPF